MKHFNLTILLLAIVCTLSYADDQKVNDTIYSIIEIMPKYAGGDHALMHFIGDNIKYPDDCLKQGWEGRVVCTFIVEKDGSLSDISIHRSSGWQSADDEALRIIRLMDKWEPGERDGRPIRCKMALPIIFRLGEGHRPPRHHDAGHERFDHTPVIDEQGDYIFVDQMPQFRGGHNAFIKYLQTNLHHPESTTHNGRIVCQFIVKKNGEIRDVTIKISSGDEQLDAEAVRVLNNMPKWLPGRQDGKKVEVKYTMPVVFK